MKKILIVVDMQNDFCLESGSLYVKGATPALWNVEELIYKENFEEVWFTVDWHEPNHVSFKDNGGEWPVHCVQYSQGAAINDLLLTACRNNDIKYRVFEKGHTREEYGAFSSFGPFYTSDNDGNHTNYSYYIGDSLDDEVVLHIPEDAGNPWLADEIMRKHPKYTFCGHIHSGEHRLMTLDDMKMANVSLVDERYIQSFEPLIIEL